MDKLNNHIYRILINEYGGSEKKETIILDDGNKYLLKKPDPTREIKRKDICPYQNNSFSEYIGCKISKNIGIETQEVSLWEYDTISSKGAPLTKIVCLCKDFRKENEELRDFERISLGSDSIDDGRKITFDDMRRLIDGIQKATNMSNEQIQNFKDFFYKIFILDALIGNTDRHPGNVGVIVDKKGDFKRIAPVYDCGSCLSPEINDRELNNINIEQLALTVDSAICELNNHGKKERIRYIDYFEKPHKEIDEALIQIFPKINLIHINQIIDDAPFLSEFRKDFYKTSLSFRYDRILTKGLLHIYPLSKEGIPEDADLYQIYKNNIRRIAELPLFNETSIEFLNRSLNLMKISNRYAICIEDGICKGIFPIRSNNDEIRRAINAFKDLGINLISDKEKGISNQNSITENNETIDDWERD